MGHARQQVDGEIVASHYPALLDDAREDLAIVTHVGRPDEKLHRFGGAEMLLIVAGRTATSSGTSRSRCGWSPRPRSGSRRALVGIRLPISRFVCKVKMSSDKDPDSQQRVLAQLRGSGPYASPALAADMERALARAHRSSGVRLRRR